jgi:hypothetical protein
MVRVLARLTDDDQIEDTTLLGYLLGASRGQGFEVGGQISRVRWFF